MKMMHYFLKNIDMFGYQASFNINKQSKHTSTFGGFFTFSIYLFLLAYVVNSFIPLIKRQNPVVNVSDKYLKNGSYLNMSSVGLGYKLDYLNGTETRSEINKYFEFSYHYVKVNNSGDFSIPINETNCKPPDFPGITNTSFNNNSLQSYRCPVNRNILINNLSQDNDKFYISLIVQLTDFGLENLEEFKKKLSKNPIRISLVYTEKSIDYDNFDTPIESVLSFDYYWINIDLYKYIYYQLSKSELISDNNLFWSEQTSEEVPYLEKIKLEEVNTLNRTEQETGIFNSGLIGIFFELSRTKHILSRSYQKIPDFLANISSLFSTILFFSGLILNYANEISGNSTIVLKTSLSKENNMIDFYKSLFEFKQNRKKPQILKSNKEAITDNNGIKTEYNRIHENEANNLKNEIELKEYSEKPDNNIIEQNIIVIDTNIQDKQNVQSFKDLEEANNRPCQSENKLFERGFTIDVKEINNHKMKRKVLTRNFFDLLDIAFCRCRKRNQNRADFVLNEIENYLDIIKYVKKHNEIEMIKNIILSQNGNYINLLSFFSNPVIKIDEDLYKIQKLYQEYLPKKSLPETKEDEKEENLKELFDLILNNIEKLYLDSENSQSEFQKVFLAKMQDKIDQIYKILNFPSVNK
jgi:hypothetical protein